MCPAVTHAAGAAPSGSVPQDRAVGCTAAWAYGAGQLRPAPAYYILKDEQMSEAQKRKSITHIKVIAIYFMSN